MSGIIHFDVPGRLMLFDETQICPVLAGLRVDGLVVGTEGQHHLIATLTTSASCSAPQAARWRGEP